MDVYDSIFLKETTVNALLPMKFRFFDHTLNYEHGCRDT